MDKFERRPLFFRIFISKVFRALLFAVIVVVGLGFTQVQMTGRVQDTQAQFVADSVRRSAIECYAIEGRFPNTHEGVQYLEDNYGLSVDHKRYVVYYESMGDNIIPRIQVISIPSTSPIDDIAYFLGLSGNGR